MVDTAIAIDLRLINENVEFLLLWKENKKVGMDYSSSHGKG